MSVENGCFEDGGDMALVRSVAAVSQTPLGDSCYRIRLPCKRAPFLPDGWLPLLPCAFPGEIILTQVSGQSVCHGTITG